MDRDLRIIGIGSVLRLWVECRKCKAALSFSIEPSEPGQPKIDSRLPGTCPSCNAEWDERGVREGALSVALSLGHWPAVAKKQPEGVGFNIGLEVAIP